MNEALD